MRIRDFVTGLSVAVLGFIGGIAATVYGIFKIEGKTDVLNDVALPGIKRTVVDTASAFISRAVFGYENRPSQFPKYTYKSYTEYRPIKPIFNENGSKLYTSDEGIAIIFDDHKDQDKFVDWFHDSLDKFGSVSYRDLTDYLYPESSAKATYSSSGMHFGWNDFDCMLLKVNRRRILLPKVHRIN